MQDASNYGVNMHICSRQVHGYTAVGRPYDAIDSSRTAYQLSHLQCLIATPATSKSCFYASCSLPFIYLL